MAEPDEWETAPTLTDTVNIAIVLCMFTGERVLTDSDELHCVYRHSRRHPNVDCFQTYVLGTAIQESPLLQVLELAQGGDERRSFAWWACREQ